MESEQDQQEMIYKFSMFEKRVREIQQQIEAVERGIVDLGTLNFGLDELVGRKDREILAALGRGIFVNAKLVSEDLTVDIGSGNFVKKSIPATKFLIEEQIKKLTLVKKELENSLQEMDKEITEMMNGIQENSHDHCNCQDEEECNCNHEEGECECEKEMKGKI